MHNHTNLFNSIIDKFPFNVVREIILAAEGFKVSRICVDEHELAEFVGLLEQNGLYAAIFDQKFIYQQDSGKAGWTSQYGIQVPVEFGHGALMVYIADSPQSALNAMKNEHGQDDRAFGGLLGIPSCCIDFYVKHIEAAESIQNDYLLFVTKNTPETHSYSYWNNIATQYLDGSLISYYPCSFNCKASEGFAKESYRILCKYSEDYASNILSKQKSNVIYTEYEGIYLLEGSTFDGDFIHYDNHKISSTLKGILYNALTRGNRLRVNNTYSGDIMNGDEHISTMRADTLNILTFNSGVI